MRAHNRVRESCATTGTGDRVCGGAPTGYATFASRYADGEELWYACQGGAEWEVGRGKYNSGANSITPVEIHESSASDAVVDFTVSTKFIWVDHPAQLDNSEIGRMLALIHARVLY